VTASAAGSIIAPGSDSAAGTLTIASLTANTGAKLQFQIGATNSAADTDKLSITGAFADSGTANLVLELGGIGAGPVVGTTYTLITPFGSTTNVDATDFSLGDHAGLTLLVAGFDLDGTADGIYFNSGTRTVSACDR